MTPSEKEKIIKVVIVIIGVLCVICYAVIKIKTLNSAIDKKDVEIKRLKEKYDLLNRAHAKLCGDYDKLRKAMIAEVMGYATHDAEEDIKKLKEDLESQQKAHAKLCEKYNNLCEATAVTEDNFHELRDKFAKLYVWYIHGLLEIKDVIAFTDWFKDTFGDFGIYDEEE